MKHDLSGELATQLCRLQLEAPRRLSEASVRALEEEVERRVQERTADLMAANEALRKELLERCRAEEELRSAREEAENANRAKTRFFANLGHEVRTPLNAIGGFSQLLEDQPPDSLSAKQRRYISNILEGSRQLLHLMDDALDLMRIDAGWAQLTLARFDVTAAVRDMLCFVKRPAAQKNIRLRIEAVPKTLPITGDKAKFKQVLYHLLCNAIQFTREGGRIEVAASVGGDEAHEDAEARMGPWLRLSVADTGIGIRPEDQARIFDEFQRAQSPYAREQQGAGLGLALTRRLVELQGGRIWVESEGEEKGSTFTFTLPIREAQGQAVSDQPSAVSHQEDLTADG